VPKPEVAACRNRVCFTPVADISARDPRVRSVLRPEAFDVRILDDRLVELRERYVDQRKAPASAVHLQMAGSVYCVSPNLWPTWPRVNIQVASLVNQPHGTLRRSRTDGTIPRTPQSHEACVDAARESQASQASPSHDIRPAPLSPPPPLRSKP
jgi:hypothetical protein